MRFLWVEDFDNDNPGREELKSAWMRYFGLEDVMVKETLDEALEYLESPDHFKQFDGILLDICFPITGDDVYEKYFSRYVTQELYDEYEKSGAGILLYLALVYRYNYSQERIAFVSAYVDHKRLESLLEMKDLIIKSSYEALNNEEWNRYTKLESVLARIYLEDTKHVKLGLNDEIPWDNEKYQLWEAFDQETQKDALLARLEEVRAEINKANQGGNTVKYNYVYQQFYRLGLIIPEAFTKPAVGSKDKSWAFYQWKKKIATPYYVLRRNAIEMCLILMNHMTPELIKPCRDSVGEIKQILDHLCRLLPDAGGRGKEYAESFVKEIALLDEQRERNKFRGTKQQEGFGSVLRLARNWGVHQGIQGLTVNADSGRLYGDVAFLFVIALRGYFNLKALPERQQVKYLQYEERLLALLGPDTPVPPLDELKAKLEGSFKMLLDRNRSAYENETAADTDISVIVSGIGNRQSKYKKEVSMDELYQLFWQQLYSRTPSGSRIAPKDPEILRILRHTYRRAWERNRYRMGNETL